MLSTKILALPFIHSSIVTKGLHGVTLSIHSAKHYGDADVSVRVTVDCFRIHFVSPTQLLDKECFSGMQVIFFFCFAIVLSDL